MTRFLIISLAILAILACSRIEDNPVTQAEYTYNVEGWESLGSQTLVLLEASNPSSLNQEIKLKVDVINTEGKVFSKDTSVDFSKEESHKDFQLMVDTEGEIQDVKVYSNQ